MIGYNSHLFNPKYLKTSIFMSRTRFRVNPRYSCLNAKELLAWNRCDIWRLNDSNGIRTHSHLVCKRTLNHLAKLTNWLGSTVSTYLYGGYECILHLSNTFMVHLSNAPYRWILIAQLNHLASLTKYLSVRLGTKWFWVRIPLLPLKLQIPCLFRETSSLTFRQL